MEEDGLLGRVRRPEDFAPGELFDWLQSREDASLQYGDAPLLYRIVGKMYDHMDGPLKDAGGVKITSQLSSKDWRTFEATTIEALLRGADQDFDFPVHVTPGGGFLVASFMEDRQRVISYGDQVTPAIIRPLKYWVVMMSPGQLAYLESANTFTSKRKMLSRSICEGVESLFTSMASTGLAHSPRLRLGPTGTSLVGIVTLAAQYVLAMHEVHHITSGAQQTHLEVDEESEADRFALRKLIEMNDDGYVSLLASFGVGAEVTDALHDRPILLSKIQVPPISVQAPWKAALFAYVRLVSDLCASGGADISRPTLHRIRDVVADTYDDPAVVDSLWQDLINPETLPGFYFTGAWKQFLEEPNASRIQTVRFTASSALQLLRLARENRRNRAP